MVVRLSTCCSAPTSAARSTPGAALGLAWLTGRHAALRTVFIRDDDGGLRRRVLAERAPVLIEQSLPPPVDDDAVTGVHATLGPASGGLLRPYERPPVVFVLSRVDAGRAVLSLLIHHALADGWSIGLLWKELFARLERATDADVRGAAPRASTMDRLIAHERSDSVARWTRQRAGELSGLPITVALRLRPRPAGPPEPHRHPARVRVDRRGPARLREPSLRGPG